MPSYLPVLSDIEQLLIARVHTAVNVLTIKGQQYKYRGHVAHFLRDIAKVYNKLPMLPNELDVLILRPRNLRTDEIASFNREFRVRRSAIQKWLLFLRENHPGYYGIEIDYTILSQLPEDNSIVDNILSEFIEPEEGENPRSTSSPTDSGSDDEDFPVENVAIPQLGQSRAPNEILEEDLAENSNTEEPRGRSPARASIPRPSALPHLTWPHLNPKPIDEWEPESRLLSLAFPYLYPTGQADFYSRRERKINFKDYIQGLLYYRDGRFGSHSRWRYTVFNIHYRSLTRKGSTYLARGLGTANTLTKEALRNALSEPNSADAKQILNSITRFARSLIGTRPYMNGERQKLEALVRALGCPDLFGTCSAADLQ